ncbi:MAG: transcriptional regulator [Paenibacillus sp.]|jgi:LacI family transcriptional regulator|nr:transcriptional regulator [Paenibacillus sp.]
MVTIKDIAKLAGVTIASVSRALNNEPGVSEAVRNKIVTIAKELHYVPNIAARRLADKQTNCIGFIFSIERGSFFHYLYDEFQRQGEEQGYSILVSFAKPEKALAVLREHFIQRVVMWSNTDWSPSREFLKVSDIFEGELLIMGGGKMEGAHRIAVDRKEALYKAVQHLAELGHRRISYIGIASDDKLVGFTLGLLEFRLEYNPSSIISSTQVGELPEDRLLDLLGGDPSERPTAVVVSSNGFLRPFLRVVRQLNLRIPEHFSVVVYDNIPEMKEIYDIPLTTVGPNVSRLVTATLDSLSASAGATGDEPKVWKDMTIGAELHVRESTRPVGSGDPN